MTATTKPRTRDKTPPDTTLARRPFTMDEYYRLAEAGILRPDERVELLEGEIITMAPIGSRHAGCVRFLTTWFTLQLGQDRAVVSSQSPVRLSDRSEPEPDVALLKPRIGDYRDRHPEPGDVLLLIEVADTTLRFDRDVKLPLYAASAIPEVWIVDLAGRRVQVFRRPEGRRFRDAATLMPGPSLTPVSFPDLTLPVEQVLGAS